MTEGQLESVIFMLNKLVDSLEIIGERLNEIDKTLVEILKK